MTYTPDKHVFAAGAMRALLVANYHTPSSAIAALSYKVAGAMVDEYLDRHYEDTWEDLEGYSELFALNAMVALIDGNEYTCVADLAVKSWNMAEAMLKVAVTS